MKKKNNKMKKANNYSIESFNEKRPLSWSAISQFRYDKESWYQKYILGGEQEVTIEMDFGKNIGERIASDPTFLPQIVRHNKMEHEFKCKLGDIHLLGFADSFCDITFKHLAEYKTSRKKWDQKRVDGHQQLDMYLLMNYLMNKVKPEEVNVTLWVIPTEFQKEELIYLEKEIKKYQTKRTMVDILKFAEEIKRVYKQMGEYIDCRTINS